MVLENISLKKYNTFGIEAKARFFVEIENISGLRTVLSDPAYKNMPRLILGGGSNLLLTKDFEGIVIKINIKGNEVISHNQEETIIKSGAGENWHELVLFTLQNRLNGMENLSLIPGTVGAAPMQNIGAYGVELKEVFYSLEAMDIQSLQMRTFHHHDCEFGYRESIFKKEAKDKYVICSVNFKLHQKSMFNVSYGAIHDTIKELGESEINAKTISKAVIHIRQSKLPDPAIIGNAGSFFKNPEIDQTVYDKLKAKNPTIPGYPAGFGKVKVPAGWLIEQAGWKGKTIGEAGVHKNQALVLVNYGNAKGNEIWDIAMQVQKSVKEKFGIKLHHEVNVI